MKNMGWKVCYYAMCIGVVLTAIAGLYWMFS